jgi:cytidylate kinase
MKKPVIVISGLPGSGSTTIAKALAERLGLDLFSPGHVHKGIAKDSIKDNRNETSAVTDAWETEQGKSKEFHKGLDHKQIDVASKGGVVICGKLSIHFLPNADLKVWLDVPLRTRAERSAGRDKISVEEAEKAILSRQETERSEFIRIYGFDYNEQKEDADLVLDTTGMAEEQSVEKILEFMEKKGIS